LGKMIFGFVFTAVIAAGAQAQPAPVDTQTTAPKSAEDVAKRQAEQQRRQAEDQRRQQDEQRRADEDARRRADEDQRRADEDRRKQAEDQRRQQDQQRRADEDARRRADEDQRRQADEQRKRAEQRREEDEAKSTTSLAKAGSKRDAPNCNDHPLFARLQDYWIESCTQKPLGSYNFDAGKRRNMVEGRYWYIRYQPPAGLSPKPSTLQLVRDAAATVRKAGGATVASDSSKETLKLTNEGKELWVEAWADHTGKYILTIVEKAAK